MNTPRFLFAATVALALGGALVGVSAQALSASGVARGQVWGHAYQNGGIGQEQVADITRHQQPYDLRLQFSEGPHNAYVADVKLRIVDARGAPVFGLGAAGPLTDVRLPAGHYRVIADFGGMECTGSVEVDPARVARLNLHWPRDAA